MLALFRNWMNGRKTRAEAKQAERMLAAGKSSEEIIGFLKACGWSQGLTSVVLGGIGVEDAKSAVIESVHWGDVRESNRELQGAIADYVGSNCEGHPEN